MPLTLLDSRRSHHQVIGPIRDRVIPPDRYQQTYEDLGDQIDVLYQVAEDAGTLVNTGSRCHSWIPALGLLEAAGRLVTSRADFLGVPDFGEQLNGCFGGCGPWRSGRLLRKEQTQRRSDRVWLAVGLC